MIHRSIRIERVSHEHGQIVLARPERRNALGLAELKQLAQIVLQLKDDPPKVLSILAEGSVFGVGGDIQEFGLQLEQGRMDEWLEQAISHFNVAIQGLRSLDSAIVIGVQGSAAGGTLGLIWASDHVIAAQNMNINLAYARIGGSPDGGTSWFLPRLVNPLRAFEMFSLSPSLDATRALQWGLVNQVVPVDALRASVDKVIAQWQNVPTVSLVNFKRLLRESQTAELAPHLEKELQGFQQACVQADFSERVRSFLCKLAD
jgi:2-(1,2-epoxy-1,2-dihydrophenyl)acetyl-CoA isomerase